MPQLELSIWFYNLLMSWKLLMIVFMIINFNKQLTPLYNTPLYQKLKKKKWPWM